MRVCACARALVLEARKQQRLKVLGVVCYLPSLGKLVLSSGVKIEFA